MEHEVHVGDVVVWHEPDGKPFNALVTAVWTQNCINVVIIAPDDGKKDPYGRQIEHRTSCTQKVNSTVHGAYWRYPDEDPNPYIPPQET